MNFIHGEVTSPGLVSIGENTLKCNTENIPEKSNVRVTVRPEDILCHTESIESPNTLEVKVKSLEFLGSFYRLFISGPTGFEELMADLSIKQIHEHNITPESTIWFSSSST